MSQDLMINIVTCCCFFVSLVFSIALINIPKYYYCVKYAVPDIFFGEEGSPETAPRGSRKGK